MERSQKENLVHSIKESMETSSVVIVAQQTGLTVADSTKLRRAIRDVGGELRVVKNTLAIRAAKGTVCEELSDLLSGPTALAFSNDPVTISKALVKFAQGNDKLSIVGGVMSGKGIDVNAVKALATLPSMEELRGRLVGLIVAPATKIARILKEPGTCIARVLNARS